MKKIVLLLCICGLFSCERYEPNIGGNSSGSSSSSSNINNGGGCTSKIRVYNDSEYYKYSYSVDGETPFTLSPKTYADMYVKAGVVNVKCKQLNGYPLTGKYEYKVAEYNTNYTIKCATINNNIKYPLLYTLRIINNDSSHRYEISINNGQCISKFILGTKKYIDLTLDAGYYNIQAEQLDWILWPTDYEHDINLNQNTKIQYK